MSDHVANRIDREDLRDDTEARVKALAASLDVAGDFTPHMYVPPGPVAEAFLNDDNTTAVIMGPLGGGKTTACIFKRIALAAQAPIAWHPEFPAHDLDRGRPTRLCHGIVLRDTFRSAEKTVLGSWKQWFPKTYPGSSSQGGNDRPFLHTLRFRGQDGIPIECITEFAGLGEDSVETMMKGREYSFGWLNELDTHAEGALEDMEQRVGRYPMAELLLTRAELEELAKRMRRDRPLVSGNRQKRVIGDMNAPTVDNWTYETLVTNRKPGRAFYQQPGGRTPNAENLFALNPKPGDDYYGGIVEKQGETFVRRMVDNQFGYSRAGKPVHPSFDHTRHVASSVIAFRPELELHIGLDISTGGLSPAATFGQANVRISVIDELFVDQGCGPARFGEALQRLMQERYPNAEKRRVKLWPDPAAVGGADREHGELDAIETIAAMLGLPWNLPFDGGNEISMRLQAVDTELRGYQEPNSALLVSPRCPLYIAGIGGRYRFRKNPGTASNEYQDLPEKAHPWSDIQDAGQYMIGGIRGRRGARQAAVDGKQGVSGSWRSQRGQTTLGGGFDVHKVGR